MHREKVPVPSGGGGLHTNAGPAPRPALTPQALPFQMRLRFRASTHSQHESIRIGSAGRRRRRRATQAGQPDGWHPDCSNALLKEASQSKGVRTTGRHRGDAHLARRDRGGRATAGCNSHAVEPLPNHRRCSGHQLAGGVHRRTDLTLGNRDAPIPTARSQQVCNMSHILDPAHACQDACIAGTA
jgi:hypothetical protein